MSTQDFKLDYEDWLATALVSSDFYHRFSGLVKANPIEVRVRSAEIVCLT